MASHEAPNACIYDPVLISPEGNLFNRIDLEKLWDSEHGSCQNPDNGKPFDINDIQPQDQLRSQLRHSQPSQEEYFAGNAYPLESWRVIPDYPFHFVDEDNMRDYVNSIARWIADYIQMPRDSKQLWKSINLLRLNCQYSHANTGLFLSVNGFETLIEALDRHFDVTGLRNGSVHGSGRIEIEETLNFCREIVKLVEILGLTRDNLVRSDAFCGIMRIVYDEGTYKKDMGRIVRITHAMLYDVRLPLFDIYFEFISRHLQNPLALSTELSLCADVTSQFLQTADNNPPLTINPLCKALGTLVSRFCDNGENTRVNEEYSDLCMALENVMEVICRLCAMFGPVTVLYMSFESLGMVSLVRQILKHALLHSRPGARLFKGTHLLFALLLAKYMYETPGGINTARAEDVKVVLDFAMSDLATHYLFNGRPRLKDLADEVVSILLDSRHAEFVLDNWSSVSY